MALSAAPLSWLVSAKVAAHWLIAGLPLVLLSPLLGLQYGLSSEALAMLALTLLIGTPVLSLFGSIGVALTVGLGSRGLILAVIVLPLSTPVLIIGAKAVTDVMVGLPVSSHFGLLGAILALALTMAPLASAAALRISVN
jgi:heme exporter protein B